jgi:MFS family permease
MSPLPTQPGGLAASAAGSGGGDQSKHSAVTVAGITLLHAFTHAFQVALIPLYLMIQRDLNLSGVNAVALIVTVYNFAYWTLSLGSGILADRFNRKVLLGVGLIGNAAAIAMMGFTRQYELLLLLGVIAGLFGTLFHPAANALASAHYPRSPGTIIGIIGIGAGIGFFFGPRIAGWRAESAGWERPLIEMGLAGIVFGVLFLLLAKEVRVRRVPHLFRGGGAIHRAEDTPIENASTPDNRAPTPEGMGHPSSRRMTPALRRRVLSAAAVLGWRDFSAHGAITLASIYLQKAQGRSVREAGLILGSMMLVSVVVNPLSVWASPRKRRLPTLVVSVILGGALLALVPWVSAFWTLPVLALFQTCSLSSFALGDAAMLERVDANVRGRVVGLFLTLAGTLGSIAPWITGWYTDHMGPAAGGQRNYVLPFAVLGAIMALAAFSAPIISRFGAQDQTPQGEQEAENLAMMAGEM